LLVLFWLAFILYIPVGLPLFEYDYDEATGLYDYREHLAINHMRTITQYLSVLFALLFNVTYVIDFKAAEKDSDWLAHVYD
jgi:hypothetical protein